MNKYPKSIRYGLPEGVMKAFRKMNKADKMRRRARRIGNLNRANRWRRVSYRMVPKVMKLVDQFSVPIS